MLWDAYGMHWLPNYQSLTPMQEVQEGGVLLNFSIPHGDAGSAGSAERVSLPEGVDLAPIDFPACRPCASQRQTWLRLDGRSSDAIARNAQRPDSTTAEGPRSAAACRHWQ